VKGPEAALKSSVARLREHFGRLDPPLTDVVRLRRGDDDLPVTGGPGAALCGQAYETYACSACGGRCARTVLARGADGAR